MNWSIFIIAVVLLESQAHRQDFGHKFRGNFWQSVAPGELLNALDLMTIDDTQSRKTPRLATNNATQPTIQPPQSTTIKPATATPVSRPSKRMIASEDNSAASTSGENDDYERTYEQFVRQYFDDAADRYLTDSDDDGSSSVEADNLSSYISEESDIDTPLDAQAFSTTKRAGKSSKNAKQKCRKVRRKREICVICKNPRNGERSETCSYEHSTEPESYAYETQRKYKKSSDRGDDDSAEAENASDAAKSSTSTANVANSSTKKNRKTLKKDDESALDASSSCIKRMTAGKACYHCRSATGERKVKCFDIAQKAKTHVRKKQPKKVENNTHQKRRIYKRTLSYVFEKGLDSNETLSSSEMSEIGNTTNVA